MRRLLVLLVVMMVVGAPATFDGAGLEPATRTAHAQSAELIAGDLDCNGSVAAADVAAGMRSLAGLGGADCVFETGDVNCSGSVDIADMTALLRHLSALPVDAPAGCPAIGTPVAAGPTSTELIEAAFARGEITRGQALLYHLYADLARDQLPPQFRGSGSGGHLESAIFDQVAAAWSGLSQAEKDALRPFMLPPAEPGSWVDAEGVGFSAAAIAWDSVGSARVRVWWQTRRPEDAARAAAILAEVDGYIWPEIVDYMGEAHAPFADTGYPTWGGDGRYDIYLVHNAPDQPGERPVLGWVAGHADAQGNYACKLHPTYMVINSRAPLGPELFSTVAHEFMHSVQWTYDIGNCNDYGWMKESTSTWVESWLYPQVNSEHGFAQAYLTKLPEQPLEHWQYKAPRQYGAYLFWYYLQHQEGMFSAVSDAWAESSAADSLQAVQAALAGRGGIRELWAKSALYNWNRPPYDQFFDRDDLFAAAEYNTTDVSVTNTPVTYSIPTDLGHMQQNHFHYAIGEGVKTLTFLNPFAGAEEEYAKVQALVSINGVWKPAALDWTDKDRVSFCREKPEEDVDELVIILSNSNYTDRTHKFAVGNAELVASPLGCKGLTGTVNTEIYYYGTTFTITATGLRFAPDEEEPIVEGFYDLVEIGSVTWEVSGVWPGDCTPSGTRSFGQPGTPDGASGYVAIDQETLTYDIWGGGGDGDEMFTITCDEGSFQLPWPSVPWIWNAAEGTPLRVEGGQLVLEGEYHDPSPAYGGTWRWNLRAQ